MPYTQEATTRTHFKKLAKYIRLNDYMLLDSKLKLIVNSIKNIILVLTKDFSSGIKFRIGDSFQQVPIYEVKVNLYDDRLCLTPNRNKIIESLNNSIDNGVKVVQQNDLFISQPEFELYINAQENEEYIFDEQMDLMSLAIGSDLLVSQSEKIQ